MRSISCFSFVSFEDCLPGTQEIWAEATVDSWYNSAGRGTDVERSEAHPSTGTTTLKERQVVDTTVEAHCDVPRGAKRPACKARLLRAGSPGMADTALTLGGHGKGRC